MSLLTFVAFSCLANSSRIDHYNLQKVVECQEDIQVTIEFWNNKYIAMALFVFLDCIKTHTYYKNYIARMYPILLWLGFLSNINYNPSPGPSKWAFAWWLPQGECFGVDMTLCHMASKQLILKKNPILPQMNASWWLKQATTLLMGTSLPSIKMEQLQRSMLCTEQSIKRIGVRVWKSLEMECNMTKRWKWLR